VKVDYDWSVAPKGSCGRSGSGFFHEKVSTKSVRVRPRYNEFGRFEILVPYGYRNRLARGLPNQRLLGSYEVANNAPWVGECADEANRDDTERSNCGTKPLPERASAGYAEATRSTFEASYYRLSGDLGVCAQAEQGPVDIFRRNLVLKAPSKRKLAKGSITVEASQTVHPDPSHMGWGSTGSGTAVRTVRFAFTKL
jgi:hypothetical protein